MGPPLLGKHFAELRSASPRLITVAAIGSLIGQVTAVAQSAPLSAFVVAAAAPWLPIVMLELVWVYRHFRWLSLFCILVVSQSVYVLEQVARMVQVHALGRDASAATGLLLGAPNADRIQLLWTVWAALGVLLLVNQFPRNPWLWVTATICAGDAGQHVLMFVGQVPIARLETQFVFSLLEVALVYLAFAVQLGHTYDAWLARVFPDLPERLLIDTTSQLEEVRLRPRERVEHGLERLFIVTRGTGQVLRDGPGGHDILLQVLVPGQVVLRGGTLVAETTMEMLALPVPRSG
jgi:hypothetical protein